MAKPAHYRGSYHVRSRRVRQAAYANPNTQCWRCGKTLAEHKRGDRWQAGHLHDGQPGGPLLPEARSCNAAAGARLTNAQRKRRKPTRTPLTW